MATPPANTATPRASSILSQEVTAITASAKPVPDGAPLSITTKAWIVLRRVFFTAADVADAAKLYDILNRMQEATLSILSVVSTNHIIPGNILRAVAFTAGQTKDLAHGLGRPWQGYFIIRAVQGSGAPVFADQPSPDGVNSSSIISLNSTNSGTYDIYVF